MELDACFRRSILETSSLLYSKKLSSHRVATVSIMSSSIGFMYHSPLKKSLIRRRECRWNGPKGPRCAIDVADVQTEFKDDLDFMKSGGSELKFVQMQAVKQLGHTRMADKLGLIQEDGSTLDLIVIGCGPAGLSLAAEAAKQGLSVGLVGPDLPFTNNYGVWEEEFTALGLETCIEHVWKETVLYMDSNNPINIQRAYGRVSRELLREELLGRCAKAGVKYLESKVERIVEENETGSVVLCENGMLLSCRLVTAASGAASGRFLHYERGPEFCVQTAYGIEVNVECCPYDPRAMVFMDYRDYDDESQDGPPSFLYVMPMSSTQVFFEETCLAARPLLSFEKLKERLYRRLRKMNVIITKVLEEEWSYIPVGVSIPDTTQQHLGFGAAASMVHPATGYSVVRSLSDAPAYAAAIASALRSEFGANNSIIAPPSSAKAAALQAWDALWPRERKRQRAFFMFGLELILQMDITGLRMFFKTFFELPEWLWKGFLAANLSSWELVWFAIITFVVAPNDLRYKLVRHLMVDPSGADLIRIYTNLKK